MRILIMVQATHQEPWESIIKTQKETWYSVREKDVDTLFYYSGDKFVYNFNGIYVPCPPEPEWNNYRFKLALDWLYDSNDPGYDFIFRTNASSYIDKRRLKEYVSTLPKTGTYNGKLGGDFASGCGFTISVDMVNILRKIPQIPEESEDVAIGKLLAQHGVFPTDAPRYQYWPNNGRTIPKVFHYRCKSDTDDRGKDILAMKHLYKYLNG